MRLQSKKKIDLDRANEARKQIDEGVKIAQKVDILRETLANLERQYATFIPNIQAELEKATIELKTQKNGLENEIVKLKQERAELRKPLDHEWAVLAEDVATLHTEKEQFKLQQYELSEKEKGNQEREKQIAQAEISLRSREESIDRVSCETSDLNDQARKQREDQQREYDLHRQDMSEGTKKLNLREKELLAQANYNDYQKDILDKREKDLNIREKQVDDKYQTLLRTINRLNK